MKEIKVERLLELYNYDKKNGQLISKRTKRPISRLTTRGYLVARVDDSDWFVHRLIWLLEGNELPQDSEELNIDHINQIKTDNRIENLRVVTKLDNLRNRPTRKDNTTGYIGVSLHKPNGKFRSAVRVTINNESVKYASPLFTTAAEA